MFALVGPSPANPVAPPVRTARRVIAAAVVALGLLALSVTPATQTAVESLPDSVANALPDVAADFLGAPTAEAGFWSTAVQVVSTVGLVAASIGAVACFASVACVGFAAAGAYVGFGTSLVGWTAGTGCYIGTWSC